jgi:hypothetical protein
MELLSRDVVPIWLRVPRREIGYVKFVFESYEGVAIVRTWDRHEAVLVVLAVPDFLADVHRVVAALAEEIGCLVVDSPAPDVLDLLGPEAPEEESTR